ncbi:MAG: trimeric intracellular cation channel family protein [Amaricoccus sp.]
MTLAQALDFASVFVFALSGGLVASRAQLDIAGFLFVACLTAVGGGTVRDVLLDRDPVFWIGDPSFIVVACAAAVLTFLGAHRLESRQTAIIWLDALALAVAVPAGVAVARGLGASWPVVLMMGVATGCFGGLMRDVVCNRVPLVLKEGELYITAALAGAAGSVLALALGAPPLAATLVCAGLTFGLRAGSIALGWRMPVYRARPPRS